MESDLVPIGDYENRNTEFKEGFTKVLMKTVSAF